MLYLIFLCIMTVLCSANEKEAEKSPEEIFKEFCQPLNLKVGVSGNCDRNTVSVFFQLNDFKYRDCFHFYNVNLSKEGTNVDIFRVEYDDTKGGASHEFKNVTPGVYKLYITPVCTLKLCPNLLIDYPPLINMSDEFCTSNVATTEKSESKSKKDDEKKTVIIIAVTASILLLIIGGSIYLAGRIKHHLNRIPDHADDKKDDTEVDKNAAFNIEVYIFHCYDRNEKMKKKVEILKDFLLKSSYFNCVKGIEDDLSAILFDVNKWLNDVLEERGKNGIIRRIILITSQEENGPDDDEIENHIYKAFIKKLNNNFERCLTGYDNLFVVQLDGSVTHTEKFKNIVRRDRYTLYGELMLDHMIDLCLNLCSGLKLDMCEVEERIRELLLEHPVRQLGNCMDLGNYV